MLYARCAYCGYTDALTCSGGFMAHLPTYVSLTPMGPTCPMCGPIPPVYMCPYGHPNSLYIPGASPTPQPGYAYAPVVQAQPGDSKASVGKTLEKLAEGIGSEVGKGIAQALFGQPA